MLKDLIIVYACVSFIWFGIVTYVSYKEMYRLQRIYKINVHVSWAGLVLGALFWPIDMLINCIKFMAQRNS